MYLKQEPPEEWGPFLLKKTGPGIGEEVEPRFASSFLYTQGSRQVFKAECQQGIPMGQFLLIPQNQININFLLICRVI